MQKCPVQLRHHCPVAPIYAVDETEYEYNERVAKQKKSWHSHWPKGIRYDVYILDGGAWDRPTPKGKVGSLEEALEIVKDLLG